MTKLTAPWQPLLPQYGVDALLMLNPDGSQVSNRARRDTDPVFDPTKRPKYFEGSGTFTFYDGVGHFHSDTIPESEDGVNIPTPKLYLPYVVPPTQATRGGSPGSVNPQDLTVMSDAVALMHELGLPLSVLSDHGNLGFEKIVYPADGSEKRRMWAFTMDGIEFTAGRLRWWQYFPNSMNGGGIDNPGRWEIKRENGSPTGRVQGIAWIPTAPPVRMSDFTGPTEADSPWTPPYRALRDNEKLIQTGGVLGFRMFEIERTDLKSGTGTGSAGTGTGTGGVILPDSDGDGVSDLEEKVDELLVNQHKIEQALGIE